MKLKDVLNEYASKFPTYAGTWGPIGYKATPGNKVDLVSQGADVYRGGDKEMDKKYNVGDIIHVEDNGEGLNLDEYLDLPDSFKTQVGVDVTKSSKKVEYDFNGLDESFFETTETELETA